MMISGCLAAVAREGMDVVRRFAGASFDLEVLAFVIPLTFVCLARIRNSYVGVVNRERRG